MCIHPHRHIHRILPEGARAAAIRWSPTAHQHADDLHTSTHWCLTQLNEVVSPLQRPGKQGLELVRDQGTMLGFDSITLWLQNPFIPPLHSPHPVSHIPGFPTTASFYTGLGTQWVKSLSRVRLFATPWTVAYQVPLSMGFSRQEYWSGWPFPCPGDLPNPGIEPGSPTL